jgi:predicted transcriptional regulator
MKPDIEELNNSPEYVRELVNKVGVSQNMAARMIGVSERSMRNYLAANGKQRAPYVVQFALECLAEDSINND